MACDAIAGPEKAHLERKKTMVSWDPGWDLGATGDGCQGTF